MRKKKKKRGEDGKRAPRKRKTEKNRCGQLVQTRKGKEGFRDGEGREREREREREEKLFDGRKVGIRTRVASSFLKTMQKAHPIHQPIQ